LSTSTLVSCCPLLICHTFGLSHHSLSTHTLRITSNPTYQHSHAHHPHSHQTPNTTITPCRCAHCGGSIVRCRHTIVYGGRRHELSVVHRRVYIDGVLCHHARSVSFDPHRCLQAVVDPPPPPPTLVHRCVHIDGVLYGDSPLFVNSDIGVNNSNCSFGAREPSLLLWSKWSKWITHTANKSAVCHSLRASNFIRLLSTHIFIFVLTFAFAPAHDLRYGYFIRLLSTHIFIFVLTFAFAPAHDLRYGYFIRLLSTHIFIFVLIFAFAPAHNLRYGYFIRLLSTHIFIFVLTFALTPAHNLRLLYPSTEYTHLYLCSHICAYTRTQS
jgi:hypothetical protein